MKGLLANSKPTVTVHTGHVKTHQTPKVFLNDTALSEQSFADISLISGDVSLQVVEGVTRFKK